MSAPTFVPFPWKVGDQAAIVTDSTKATTMRPTTIKAVGRVWVTTRNGSKFRIDTGRPQGPEYGFSSYLMTPEQARTFTEHNTAQNTLSALMSRTDWLSQLTTKQMRAIIEIIQPKPHPLNMHGEPFDLDMGHVPGSSTP